MLRYLFALLCLFQIESAHAACSTITTGIRPINPILTVPGPDAPLVTPLSPWYLVANSRIFANCPANQPLVIGVASSNKTAGYFTDPIDGNNYTIFKFEMSNTVGYIVAAGPPGGSNMQPALPQNSGIGPFNTFTVTPSTSDLYASYKYRLIRYATLTDTNSFNMGGFASLILYWKTPDAPKFDPYVYTSFVQDGTVSFTNSIFKTCSILSTSLQVALPKIDANQLNSINSTAGSTAFSLPLNCPSPVNLYMTITDISAPGQTSNIVSLTSDSGAKGVGIQIQRNGQPVSMGPDSSAAYTTNQFLVGALSGSINIPFSANYIRTGPVIGGSVKAITTFTLSYQ